MIILSRGEKEGWRKEEREEGWEGEREVGREGGREGGWKGGREGGIRQVDYPLSESSNFKK